jgi:hypothetical protein
MLPVFRRAPARAKKLNETGRFSVNEPLDFGYAFSDNDVDPAQRELPGSVAETSHEGIDVAHRTDTGPFAMIPGWLLELTPPSRALHLYALLALHADRAGRSWPSRKRLCAEMGVSSVNTVVAALKELEQLRAVTVTSRFASYGQTSNSYIVHRIPPEARQSAGGAGAADWVSPRAVERAQNQTHVEPDSGNQPIAASRNMDPLWDAVMVACGVNGPVTKNARGAYNRAVGELRDIGATADEVATRAHVYRVRWPDVSLTPTALSRRWAECLPDPAHLPQPRVRSADAAVARVLAEGQ